MIRKDPDATPIRTGLDGGEYRLASCETGWMLVFILSWEMNWEHVSVRAVRAGSRGIAQNRTPTWKEMCQVKAACWDDDDCVLQFHPPQSDYINVHPNVLHLWRPLRSEVVLPPRICV